MLKIYHEPLWNPNNIQDPLPKNWEELSKKSWALPENFWVVQEWKLYRSAIVYPQQVRSLQALHWIEHIISLIDWDWLKEFYNHPTITIHKFPILERKALTKERIDKIIELINSLTTPALVHCLKWATRTGMVASNYEIIVMNKSRLSSILNGTFNHNNFNISAIREIARLKKLKV